jgi:hypothetical protein
MKELLIAVRQGRQAGSAATLPQQEKSNSADAQRGGII